MPCVNPVQTQAYVEVSPFNERITADKWHPEAQRPRFDLIRSQYLHPYTGGILTEAAPFNERITPDKWYAGIEKPLFDLKRQQAAAPTTFFTEVFFAERVSEDKWHVEIKQSQFDLKRTQYSYPFEFRGDTPRLERVSEDKWHSVVSDISFAVKPGPKQTDPFVWVAPVVQSVFPWYQETQRPRWDLPRNQFLYQNYDKPPGGSSASPITQVGTTQTASAAGTGTATTTGIDTTGATLLIITLGGGAGNPASTTISDSNGNTWQATSSGSSPVGGGNGNIWYSYNKAGGALVVGPNHTVSASGNTSPSIVFTAWAGTLTGANNPFDSTAGANSGISANGTSTTVQPGFITPTFNNELVITSGFTNNTSGSMSINNSYTIAGFLDFSSGVRFGCYQGYLLQSTAAATNPTWTLGSGTAGLSATISAFMPAQSFLERTTPDKWHPDLERPRWDVSRRQAAFPAVFDIVQTTAAAPPVLVPSWYTAVPYQPLFDLRRQQATFPPLTFTEAFFAETIKVDEWHPEIQRPRFDVARAQYDNPTLTFSEIFFAETILEDKWHFQSPGPRWDLARNQSLYQWDAFDPMVLPPLASGWLFETQRPRFDLPRTQWTYPSEFRGDVPRAERVSEDKFHIEIERPRWDAARWQYNYPFSAFTETQFVETIFEDKWHFDQPRVMLPPLTGPKQYDAWQFVSSTPIVLASSWHSGIELPRFDTKRAQYNTPNLAFTETFFTERVSEDKWHIEIERPRWDLSRLQYNYPIIAFDPQPFPSPVFAGTWHPELEKPRWERTPRTYSYPTEFRGDVPRLERVSEDKWHFEIQQPRFDTKRWQIIYPAEFRGDVTRAENVSADRWFNSDPMEPLFDRRRQQYAYPTTFFDENFFIESVFMDKWWQPAPGPRFDTIRNQFLFNENYLLRVVVSPITTQAILKGALSISRNVIGILTTKSTLGSILLAVPLGFLGVTTPNSTLKPTPPAGNVNPFNNNDP